jgi:hypothetical protein
MRVDATPTRPPTVSWLPVATVAGVTALSAAYVGLTPAGDQTELTGRTWEQFASQDQEVASLVSRLLAVLGLIGAAFAALALVVAVGPYRSGARWAWYALWLVPITFAAVAARMLADQYAVGWYYAVLTGLALLAMLIPIRRFMPSAAVGERS